MATFHVAQEGPINALALNRDFTQVAIGGRSVFKVYAIEDDKFREVCNLRASKHLNLGFSCNDVSWSFTDDHYLATAATNGHVCVWNLGQTGKAMQEQDYQDHKRTVHKVNFHASEPNKLISGSQDGTMRYFDIRVKSAVAVFDSNTESIRDVQFSPHNPYTFSAVSENGNVQLWDVRKTDKCQQQFTAHSGPIFACDWHPENLWLATASRDKTIKVWDLTTKPNLEHTIHTIASIGHVKWRPQYKYHIASCALVVDCSINIWDVRRPYIPFASFSEHKDIASGVAWKEDPHTFLSSGRDATLYQHSFNDAFRPASKANPQGVSLNNKGEVLFAMKTNALSNPKIKANIGFVRKSSNTQTIDQFHIAQSVLRQFPASAHSKRKKPSSFINLAKNYILSGRSFSEMCEHNSVVAKRYGKNKVAVFWKIIKTMYGEEFLQNSINATSNNIEDVVSHNNVNLATSSLGLVMELNIDSDRKSRGGGDTPAAQFSDETETEDQPDHAPFYSNGFPSYLNVRTGLPKGDFCFGENELDMEIESILPDYRNGFRSLSHITSLSQDWHLPTEAFHLRHEIRDRSPPSDQYPNHNSPDIIHDEPQMSVDEQPKSLLSVSILPQTPRWDPSITVWKALEHRAILGDVQTAACVLIVLGEQRKTIKNLDENTQEHWLLGYVELLTRFQLWNIANLVIKSSWLPSVAQLNHQSTRYVTNCGKCSKSLQRIGWLCDKCHSSKCGLCSVCHQVVKGLYVWCQGCSHGGHLAHVRQWFASYRSCPTGCGHLCEFR